MSNVPFTQRLGAFKQRFQQVLGNRGSGYDELAQLEQPLVGDDTHYGAGDNYEQSHGVSRPAQYSGYSGMGGEGGAPAGSALTSQVAQTIPSQVGPFYPLHPAANVSFLYTVHAVTVLKIMLQNIQLVGVF